MKSRNKGRSGACGRLNGLSRLTKRLRARAGESITEVLIALLVSAVGLMLLAGLIVSTAHLIEKSRSTMHEYVSSDLALMEKGASTMSGTLVMKCGTESVKLTDDDLFAAVEVVYYSNPNSPDLDVVSYRVK